MKTDSVIQLKRERGGRQCVANRKNIFACVIARKRDGERKVYFHFTKELFYFRVWSENGNDGNKKKRERGDESIELQSRANVMVERHLGTLYQSNEGSILL